MRGLVLILMALPFVAGWTGCERKPTPPKVVYVTVEKTVGVPAELSRDCQAIPKQDNTYAEAVRLANARGAANEECTSRMRKIRALAPEAAP